MAHCTLCHADFVMTFQGNGGHACPFKPQNFEDAHEIVIATSGFDCATCDRARREQS